MDIHFPSSVTSQAATLIGRAHRFIALRLQRTYTTVALIIFDTLVLLVFVNLTLGIIFMMRDARSSHPEPSAPSSQVALTHSVNHDDSPAMNGKRSRYQLAWIDFDAYGETDASYVADVLDDFYDLAKAGMAYQPWIEFGEPAFRGKRVVVDSDVRGFLTRHTANPPNQDNLPVVKVFTFGGSTTFGYNVSDEQTWPSYLSSILNEQARAQSLGFHIEVVNYGRAYYYPSQETALLMDLLKSGYRPQVAVFLDGVNTGEDQDVPEFHDRLKAQFHSLQFATNARPNMSSLNGFEWIPLVRFADSLAARLHGNRSVTVAQRERRTDSQKVQHRVNMFRQNRSLAKAICTLYAVEPLFVLQPHAVYNYPVTLYRRSLPDEFYAWRINATALYEQMRGDPDIVYLGRLFESWGPNRKAIIDEVHYSPGFHFFLAQHIADRIDLKVFNPRRQVIDEYAATGNSRLGG